MLTYKPYSASLLAFEGFILIVIGVYFVILRPSLLPEDYKYIETTTVVIQENIPQLSVWLQKVFWVMGSYIFTSGVLTIYIALTSFHNRLPGAFSIIVLTGISSFGSMTFVNFMIGSDFRWILLTFTLLWVIALILYRFNQ